MFLLSVRFHDRLELICNRQYIQSACATNGDGLYEGLNWLSENLRKRGAA